MRWPAAEARVKVLTIQPAMRTGICMMPISRMNDASSPAVSRPSTTSLPPTSRIAPIARVKTNVMNEPWEANSRVAA